MNYILSPCIMSVQYAGVCAVQQGMFSTPGGYHEYSAGYHEYSGDTMSTLGVYHEYTGGYHDKCGGRSLGKQLNLYGNPSELNIPRCIHDIPSHSSWCPPGVLMISPSVLNTPWCTHDIPPVYDIPQCTEHPPVYCTDITQGDYQVPSFGIPADSDLKVYD